MSIKNDIEEALKRSEQQLLLSAAQAKTPEQARDAYLILMTKLHASSENLTTYGAQYRIYEGLKKVAEQQVDPAIKDRMTELFNLDEELERPGRGRGGF